jgi:hypothetical protein
MMMNGHRSFSRAAFFSQAASGLLWLSPPPERQASAPGGGANRIGVVGAPCPMLRWPGCARRSQEPRPRRVCITNGKASCRLVRFGFGRCWDLFGGVPAGFFLLFIISYRVCGGVRSANQLKVTL